MRVTSVFPGLCILFCVICISFTNHQFICEFCNSHGPFSASMSNRQRPLMSKEEPSSQSQRTSYLSIEVENVVSSSPSPSPSSYSFSLSTSMPAFIIHYKYPFSLSLSPFFRPMILLQFFITHLNTFYCGN